LINHLLLEYVTVIIELLWRKNSINKKKKENKEIKMKYIPCIKYGYELKTNEMDSVKLEKMVQGTTRKRTVPVFAAKYGVAGLFHVIDKFNRAADKLGFTVAEKWSEFEEVLDDTAEQKWTNHINGIAANQRTQARFDQSLSEFVHSYSGSPEPRDVLKEYIRSDECRKPRNIDPDEHAARIETLCRFANRLSGDEPPYDEETTKKAVFTSFPEKWQREYLKSGKSYVDDGMEDIVGYMNLIKGMADEDDSKLRKRRRNDELPTRRIRGGNVTERIHLRRVFPFRQ
jgi:hypothetical protein